MKKVLIISPYFPPSNAADCHRVRMSLPYFATFGYEVEVVTVDASYAEMAKDILLIESVPNHIRVHKVKALPKKWTAKFGLGSLALRSLWFYFIYVNKLLKREKLDLIYFSTTQFPVCVLGAYWKKKFGIPYVIDLQDPWHTDYFQNKPKNQRPPKYWFSYRLNKYLEPIALKRVDGIISVSGGYFEDIKKRYPTLKQKPAKVIPFSAERKDFDIAKKIKTDSFLNPNDKLKIVYAGAVGSIMESSIKKILEAFKCLSTELQDKTELYFLGTSYAPKGKEIGSVLPIAKNMGIQDSVIEKTDRLGFYDTLRHLMLSDGLLIVGSDDLNYNPSKIYTYLLANKQIFSLLNNYSPGNDVLKNYIEVYQSSLLDSQEQINANFRTYIDAIIAKKTVLRNEISFTPELMTKQQVELFNAVLNT